MSCFDWTGRSTKILTGSFGSTARGRVHRSQVRFLAQGVADRAVVFSRSRPRLTLTRPALRDAGIVIDLQDPHAPAFLPTVVCQRALRSGKKVLAGRQYPFEYPGASMTAQLVDGS